MNIHQLSVSYLGEQDRILVRVSTTTGEETRLWLTRRLMRGWWPLLTQAMDAVLVQGEPAAARPELRSSLAQLRREQFLQQADFATPYQDTRTRPLGDDPLLVTEVEATVLPGQRLRLGFAELLPGRTQGRNFQMEAEAALLQGFTHLVAQALATSGWRQGFDAAAAPGLPAADADGTAPAPLDDTERPRYLN